MEVYPSAHCHLYLLISLSVCGCLSFSPKLSISNNPTVCLWMFILQPNPIYVYFYSSLSLDCYPSSYCQLYLKITLSGKFYFVLSNAICTSSCLSVEVYPPTQRQLYLLISLAVCGRLSSSPMATISISITVCL